MKFELDSETAVRGERRIRRHVHKGNGLRVIAMVDPAAPVVSYQTWFGVGSADERPGKTGLAHFFEHLMFTQTERHGPGEFDRTIESCGGDTNAATWLDWTYYRDSIPSAELERIIALEADRMDGLVLTSEVVESEREVILNERRERVDDDIDGFLDEKLMSLAFGQHAYGWPTIGWQGDIEGLSIADLQQFYARFYAPDNATIVMVGDLDESRALALVDAHYGHLRPSGKGPRSIDAIDRGSRPTREVFEKPVAAERALMGWVGPAQTSREWSVLEVASNILAGSPSSRLYRRLVVDTELASSVSCSMLPLRQAGFFEIAVHAAGDHTVSECQAVIDAALTELTDAPVSDGELAKVKAGMLTDFWSEMVSVDGKAESLGHHELTCGHYAAMLEVPDILATITADEVRAACRTYLTASERRMVVAVPE